MAIVKFIAYETNWIVNDGKKIFQSILPFDVIKESVLEVKNIEDIQTKMTIFGEEISKTNPDKSFAIQIMFQRGSRIVRGYHEAAKAGKFPVKNWTKLL